MPPLSTFDFSRKIHPMDDSLKKLLERFQWFDQMIEQETANQNPTYEVSEHKFPLSREVLDVVDRQNDPLGGIVSHDKDPTLTNLRSILQFTELPHIQKVANLILNSSLGGLTMYRQLEPEIEDSCAFWLSFTLGKKALYIQGPQRFDTEGLTRFPFHKVPGLREFQETFGGLVLGTIPPGACFYNTTEMELISGSNPLDTWGNTEGWDGSLQWYHSCSGNLIVVRPDGAFGAWDHELAADEESPFWRLDYDFPAIIDQLCDFIRIYLGAGHKELDGAEENPFYY